MPNSVEKTMIILRAVSDGKGAPVSLERISSDTGINKSTLSHIVSTLAKSGYLQRVSHNEGYIIGPELHFLTRYGRYGEDIISVCHPILEHLARITDATAVFAILGGDKKYIIDRVSPGDIYGDREATILGDDIYRTVTGRVLLANIPTDEAIAIYKSLGKPEKGIWNEASNINGFLSALSRIKELDCYYVSLFSPCSEWHSFALPIYRGKKFYGSLGLAIRKDVGKEKEPDIVSIRVLMIKCKKEIERRLRFNG